jgi:poly-beta-1,6-N-acetyl-D-glucosamine N-deacetylase
MKYNIRNMMAFLVANTFIYTGIVRRAIKKALRGKYILSIYCHAPEAAIFESSIHWLLKQGFHFISLGDLEAIKKGEKEFPKGAVLLTVDDGWKSNQQNVFDIAARYQVPVGIFISTQPIEEGVFWWSYVKENKKDIARLKQIPDQSRVDILKKLKEQITIGRQALTKKQVSEIAANKLVSVGSHTVSHPILINCSDEAAMHEIAYSKNKIETWISKPVRYFSYPNGDYSKREIDIVQRAGYALALTTETDYLTKDRLQQHYTLPRFEILDNASLSENICRMTGVWQKYIK